MAKNRSINVQNVPIAVSSVEAEEFLSLTDIAAAKAGSARAADVIKNWLRNRTTLEYLGTWEQIYNPSFKVVEFDHFRREAGLHTFVISASDWIERTDAVKNYLIRRTEHCAESAGRRLRHRRNRSDRGLLAKGRSCTDEETARRLSA